MSYERYGPLATKIKDGPMKDRGGWVDAVLEMASAIKEQALLSGAGFAKWCGQNKVTLGKHDITALIAMADYPTLAREVLEKTKSRSLEHIYRSELRPLLPSRPKGRPKGIVSKPTPAKVIDISSLPASTKERLDAAIRAHKKGLDAQFEDRVRGEVQRRIMEVVLPAYEDRLAKADAILAKSERSLFPFSPPEFRQLLAALHPDSPVERRTAMFTIVNDRKAKLCNPVDVNERLAKSGLPRTVEEMLARKKTKTV